jgi:hypothetical protein
MTHFFAIIQNVKCQLERDTCSKRCCISSFQVLLDFQSSSSLLGQQKNTVQDSREHAILSKDKSA